MRLPPQWKYLKNVLGATIPAFALTLAAESSAVTGFSPGKTAGRREGRFSEEVFGASFCAVTV